MGTKEGMFMEPKTKPLSEEGGCPRTGVETRGGRREAGGSLTLTLTGGRGASSLMVSGELVSEECEWEGYDWVAEWVAENGGRLEERRGPEPGVEGTGVTEEGESLASRELRLKDGLDAEVEVEVEVEGAAN